MAGGGRSPALRRGAAEPQPRHQLRRDGRAARGRPRRLRRRRRRRPSRGELVRRPRARTHDGRRRPRDDRGPLPAAGPRPGRRRAPGRAGPDRRHRARRSQGRQGAHGDGGHAVPPCALTGRAATARARAHGRPGRGVLRTGRRRAGFVRRRRRPGQRPRTREGPPVRRRVVSPSRGGSVPRLPAVRLYESLRTAHLERAHQLAPASIVHRVTRYDFDESLAVGLDLVQAGPVRAAWLVGRSGVRVLEVNEPLMTSSLPGNRPGARRARRCAACSPGGASPS